MNQKRFINIILRVIIVVLVGTVAYFVFNRQPQPISTPTPTPKAPTSGPVTVKGEIICLTKKGSDQHTLECGIGLKGGDGRQYGLKNLFKLDPEYKFSSVGMQVEASGIFSAEQAQESASPKYDMVGTIDVTSIKEITDESTKSSTGTVSPVDPNKDGVALYPDSSLTSLPTEPVSVKFVVEHRSALNGKTMTVRGFIVSTLLGEKACPSDRGMCAQPSLFLADTTEASRNQLYDLRVLVSEEEQESNYLVGKTVVVQVIVDGSEVSVVARKIY